MNYRKYNNKFIVSLERGEEIVESIKNLAKKESIRLGIVSGIGAVNKATIGIFDPDIQVYTTTDLCENLEIVSLAGNITEMNGEVYIHLHIALSDSSYSVHAGHLNIAIISAAGEIIIDVIDGVVDRKYNKEIGLNLLKL